MNGAMDWEQAGTVAVWVGNFASREQFDIYLHETIDEDLDIQKPINRFAADVGFGFYDYDRQEAERFDDSLPIAELLEPFSNSASFASKAVETAGKLDISEADTVILLFDCKYSKTTAAAAPVQFVGNFVYE